MSEMNCSTPEVVDASGDIIGPGVLAAFFGSAVITILAVLWAYIFESVEDDLLNDLDRRILLQFRHSLRRFLPSRERLQNTNGYTVENLDRQRRQLRIKPITNFILALSDQQLLTGLAILIAGVSGKSHLSGYEFQVVLSLAWFSSTTHLATLDVLRNEFNAQGIIREIRVVGILGVLGLLMYTFEVCLLIVNPAIPLECPQDSTTIPSSEVPGPDATVDVVQVSLAIVSIIAFVLALLIVIFGYFARLQRLYFGKRSIISLGLLRLERLVFRPPDPSPSPTELYEEKEAASKRKAIHDFRTLSDNAPADNTFLRRFLMWRIATNYSYGDSFLSTLPSIAFSFTYGVAQVVVYRWTTAPSLSEESSEWGFGQLVALLLLCLPFLSAGEAFYDYKTEADKLLKPQRVNDTSLVEHNVIAEDHRSSPPTAATIVEQEYNSHKSDIKLYFPVQARRDNLTANEKGSILDHYSVLKRAEKEMYDQPVWPIFTMSFVLSVVLGVLLNSPNNVQNLVGALLLVGWLGGWVFPGQVVMFYRSGYRREFESVELQAHGPHTTPVLRGATPNPSRLEAGAGLSAAPPKTHHAAA